MSDAAAQAGAPPVAGGAASASPWLIAVLVALATFMEVLDTTIANTVLHYFAGGMGVSDDEASWVITTYLVANAVSLTASPFLARRLGRKTFFTELSRKGRVSGHCRQVAGPGVIVGRFDHPENT